MLAVARDPLPAPSAQYFCTTRVESSARPRVRTIGLSFPPGAIARDGETFIYRHRVTTPAGRTLRSAECVIPRSSFAISLTHKRFHQPGPPTGAWDERGKYDVILQGCVKDEYCELEELVVIAEPPQPVDECAIDQYCEGYYGGGGEGGTGGGSTGFPSEPPDSTFEDGSGRPACTRDAENNCILRDLTGDEWDRLVLAIERIRETNEYCIGAKEALRGLVARGRDARRFRFWDGYDKEGPKSQIYGENLMDGDGYFIRYDSYWVWNDPSLVVHEGLHLYKNYHPDNEGLVPEGEEDWVVATAPTCM